MSNPFVKSPLTDNNLFAGRKSEISQIQHNLRKKSIPSLMLVGERGVGKTSLLNFAENYAKYVGVIAVRINLTSADSSDTKHFFSRLFLQSCLSLIENDHLGGKDGYIHNILKKYQIDISTLEPEENIFETFFPNTPFTIESLTRDFIKVSGLVQDSGVEFKKLLILIDEVEKIYDSSEIIENIRFFIQNPDSFVSFIFSGDKSYQTKEWEKIFQTYRGVIQIIDIDNFQSNEDVEDYFTKLLSSIKWDIQKDVIEGEKFKEFYKTCFDLFLLTRGKPAFISSIAYKMFERYELNITRKLVFDKDLRQDLKLMLSESGSISTSKISRIETLNETYKAWLKYLFSCRWSQLDEFYHNIKFIFLNTEHYLTQQEFTSMVDFLQNDLKILALESNVQPNDSAPIGFALAKPKGLLERRFEIYFGPNVDEASKLWLHIDGQYKFETRLPKFLLIRAIFSDFLTERYQVKHHEIEIPDSYFPSFIKMVQNDYSDISDLDFYQIRGFYALLKSAKNTKDKFNRTFIIITLSNENGSAKSYVCWATNFKNKLIHVELSKVRIEKWEAKFKSDFYFESARLLKSISKYVIEDSNLNKFENVLLASESYQVQRLVIDDKINDLVNYFEKEESSVELEDTIKIIYDSFVSGIDIGVQGFNNLGFVFLHKGDFEKSELLLKQAIEIFSFDNFTKEIEGIKPSLTLYNLCILYLKTNQIDKAENYYDILCDLDLDSNWTISFLISPSIKGNVVEYNLFRDPVLASHVDLLGSVIRSL